MANRDEKCCLCNNDPCVFTLSLSCQVQQFEAQYKQKLSRNCGGLLQLMWASLYSALIKCSWFWPALLWSFCTCAMTRRKFTYKWRVDMFSWKFDYFVQLWIDFIIYFSHWKNILSSFLALFVNMNNATFDVSIECKCRNTKLWMDFTSSNNSACIQVWNWATIPHYLHVLVDVNYVKMCLIQIQVHIMRSFYQSCI